MNEIIITTISITGISAIFAFLLTLADRTIGNYGEIELNINDDKDYTVQGGSSLLSTLIDEKIFIPSACGGKGTCGYCKVKVLEGGGPVLPTEIPFVILVAARKNTLTKNTEKIKKKKRKKLLRNRKTK